MGTPSRFNCVFVCYFLRRRGVKLVHLSCIQSIEEFWTVHHDSGGESAVKHSDPGLRLHAHVHCLPNMWKHRGSPQNCSQQNYNKYKVMKNYTVVTVTQDFEYEWIVHVGVILCQVIFHFLFSKLLSRVWTTSPRVDIQGYTLIIYIYIYFMHLFRWITFTRKPNNDYSFYEPEWWLKYSSVALGLQWVCIADICLTVTRVWTKNGVALFLLLH